MELNTLDVLVLLKIHALKSREWTQTFLAEDLNVAQSQVHNSLKRAAAARLFNPQTKQPSKQAFLEFLIHGVKYAYPPVRGGLTRGIPTSYAAEPLREYFKQSSDPPPVWPYAEGTVRGCEFEPLDKRAPKAALNDPELYKLLVLIDAIRDARPRESNIAINLLRDDFNAG